MDNKMVPLYSTELRGSCAEAEVQKTWFRGGTCLCFLNLSHTAARAGACPTCAPRGQGDVIGVMTVFCFDFLLK